MEKIFKTAIVLVFLDALWIAAHASTFTKLIEKVQKTRKSLRYSSIIFTYAVVIAGLYYFIIKPHRSALDAAFLGFLIYGIYNGTNYAIFNNWSLKVFFIDVFWGAFLFAATTKIVQYN
jgi:uncharacterized membrane protein